MKYTTPLSNSGFSKVSGFAFRHVSNIRGVALTRFLKNQLFENAWVYVRRFFAWRHPSFFGKAFLFLEDDSLCLFAPDYVDIPLNRGVFEDAEKFHKIFENFSFKHIDLFVELADQTLGFETCPKELVWTDLLRLLRARRHLLKKNNMFWLFRPFFFSPQESLAFGLPLSESLKALLEILTAHNISTTVYSLSLERAAYVKVMSQELGTIFAKRTLTMVIQPSRSDVRHFLFWGKRLVFMRTIRNSTPGEQLVDSQKFVVDGEETLAYVRKQRKLTAEPVFWIFLPEENSLAEEAVHCRDLWHKKGRILSSRLREKAVPFSLKIFHLYKALKTYRVLTMGLVFGGLSLQQIACFYSLGQKTQKSGSQILILDQQRLATLKRFEKFPGISLQTCSLLLPFVSPSPPPLKFLEKISALIPLSAQLRNFGWKALLDGQHEVSFDIDTPLIEKELEPLRRTLKVIEIMREPLGEQVTRVRIICRS